MQVSINWLLGIASTLACVHATATCYNANTHVALDSHWTPCNSSTPFSMCYRTTQLGRFAPDTACYSNGIARFGNATNFSFWRESCTDPSWESPYCQKAFAACPGDNSGNAVVFPCDGDAENSTNWCCGNSNSCCDSSPIVIAKVLGPTSTSSSSSVSSSSVSSTVTASFITSSSRTTSSMSNSASPTANPATSSPSDATPQHDTTGQKSGLSTGAKAGIGIAAAIVGIAAIILAIWFCRRRVRESRAIAASQSYHPDSEARNLKVTSPGAPMEYYTPAPPAKTNSPQSQTVSPLSPTELSTEKRLAELNSHGQHHRPGDVYELS